MPALPAGGIVAFGLAASLAVAVPSFASDSCDTDPQVVAKCFTVHGRLFASNGAPGLRIWVIGTHRILGVSESHAESAGYPLLPEALSERVTFGTDYLGDYKVCPFTPQKEGVMQFVCVQSVSHLKAVKQ